MEIKEWQSKRGKHYITFINPIEGVKFCYQPDLASICLDTKKAYVRHLGWNDIVRQYAREHGMGDIKIILEKVKTPKKKSEKPRYKRKKPMRPK